MKWAIIVTALAPTAFVAPAAAQNDPVIVCTIIDQPHGGLSFRVRLAPKPSVRTGDLTADHVNLSANFISFSWDRRDGSNPNSGWFGIIDRMAATFTVDLDNSGIATGRCLPSGRPQF